MKQRIDINTLEPNGYKAVLGLEKYLGSITLKPLFKELIKIRASQINGCAYCIQMHAEAARKLGETENRIYALSAWKESPLFNEEERVLLAMTDEITEIANKGLTEETYLKAREVFTENAIAQIILQICTINVWNRIAVSIHMFHTNG